MSNATNATRLVPYNPGTAVAVMRQSPRFGHTGEIAVLFSDDNSDRVDYLLGLIFIGAFVVSLLAIWGLILLIFRCMGPDRVGFLSGFAMHRKYDVVHYPRPFRVRLSFIIASIIFVVFSVLLVTHGITNLQDTTISWSNSNGDVQLLLADAEVIIEGLERVGESSQQLRDQLVGNLGTFCPSEPNVEAQTGYDFDRIANDAIALLNQLGDFINNDVSEVKSGINRVQGYSLDVENVLNNVDVNDWQALIVIIPFVLVPALFVVGVMMAWFGASISIYQCLLSWLFMPLFVIIVIVAIVGSASAAWTAVANADFCSGGPDMTPDGTVLEIMDIQNFVQNDIVREAVQYYVSQCTVDTNPFAFIDEYQVQIVDSMRSLTELDTALDAVSIPTLSLLCGKNFTSFALLLNTMTANLKTLDDSAKSALDLLSCQRIVPIYTGAVYSGGCNYSMSGFTWLFSSLLVLSCMGMIMIMLRSAYLDVDDDLNGASDALYEQKSYAQEQAQERDDYEDEEQRSSPSHDARPF